ncbi:MAG: N-acetylglucosamine-6-phosphate deacetylase, partial [Clostridia bacterium]|nr:N-acetylglucosamine-6-phosphate deacetylase [Clostridia bacterium]
MLITAERILTGTDVLCPGWLEITDGTISALGQGTPPRPIDPTAGDLELGPQIVVPGFVDMHTHGGGSGAFPDATEQSSRTAVALHRRHGTTTLIASLVSAHPEELLREVSVLGEQVQEGLIAGIHLEGPWLSSRRCGAHE